ncbi:class I SAM-dependent methyltransferase [Nodularia harveyana UHCC-0300]|uniref:Class I SAM-dependent methyltransferase n=1 Tax=Nodularia harveyana UHCC-0300 TaxID=2974287 RepID=A0ABU5UE69_9CYAN|nr:class I SAM-dependent methyltransferase [Nodularia harveyana]MEA5581415.1 class I SAM-dependent methyltransferase [Nodularia harveyana UHCC-0300]
MQRIMEPEVMDTWEEAIDYDTMNFAEVNRAFALDAIALNPNPQSFVLDAGTGTGRIPILICKINPQWQILAIDLAANMLRIASENIQQANLQQQITCELVDAKNLPYTDGVFDMVISNSLVHHLPDPLPFFQELKRVTKPNSGILIRDLLRPANQVILNTLVESVGNEYNSHQKKLFRDSLQAALTIDEVEQLVSSVDLVGVKIYQSSELHWTIERAGTF